MARGCELFHLRVRANDDHVGGRLCIRTSPPGGTRLGKGNGACRSCNDGRKLFLGQVEILPLWKFRPVNTLIIPVANPARRASAPLRRQWQLAESVAGGTWLTAHGVPEHGHTATAWQHRHGSPSSTAMAGASLYRTVISRRPHTVRPCCPRKDPSSVWGPHCLAPDADIILASQGLPLGFSSRALEPDPPVRPCCRTLSTDLPIGTSYRRRAPLPHAQRRLLDVSHAHLRSLHLRSLQWISRLAKLVRHQDARRAPLCAGPLPLARSCAEDVKLSLALVLVTERMGREE